MPDTGPATRARATTAAPDCDALRIVFAGTPAFAASALAALLASRHAVVGVLSQPDRPSGRGRKLVPGAVKALALAHGVPVQQPTSLRDADAVAALAALGGDVMVVAAYGLLLPREVLGLPPLGCLNIHASLLPRWRGAAPIQRAILAGDALTGIAVMRMDAGLDTGDVLLTREVPIPPDIVSGELHDRLAEVGAETIVAALEGHCRGTSAARAQPADGVTYAAKLDKAEARLDFSRPASELDRAVRAFNPWPVAEAALDGERVRLWRSRLPAKDAPALPPAAPGTVLGWRAGALVVATGHGELELLELQRDGGRALPAEAFAQGRDPIGRRFGQADGQASGR